MLLLWSRLAALALLASLATCSPVSPSPLKDVDTAFSREPAHRNEQIANLKKRGISVSPTLDFNSNSILSRRFSHDVLPAIALCSPGATYSPGDKVLLKWNKSLFYTKADIWIQYSGKDTSAQLPLLVDIRLRTSTLGYIIELPPSEDIPWYIITNNNGRHAEISANVFFRFSRDDYTKDPGVFGKHSQPFTIWNK